MKRFSPREFLFLCAPILLVGAGFIAVRLLHPPRDPDAVIALRVTTDPNPPNLSTPLAPELSFGWNAEAKGGPQDEIQLLYAQKLVALGDGRSQILFASPAMSNAAGISANGGGGGAGPAFQSKSQNLGVPYDALPIWTKRVEWRGDFVAVPLNPGSKNISGVGNPATFPMLARIKGAARASQTFALRFDARQINPIQSLNSQIATPDDAEQGADTWIRTRFLDSQRRICARLVAIDNGVIHPLWSNFENADVDNPLWINGQESGIGSTWTNDATFKLRDVPAQWGEIIYVVDAAYNPVANNANTMGDTKDCDAAEIARLKNVGWLTFSRRLTVRKAGAQILAPNYSKTPNTKDLNTQTSISKTDWIIKVRLRYDGPKLQPNEELYISSGPEFIGANGKITLSGGNGMTEGIRPGTKPNEYLATITVPLQALGQPRPVTLQMDIADMHAAPLHFQTKLQVPRAPA